MAFDYTTLPLFTVTFDGYSFCVVRAPNLDEAVNIGILCMQGPDGETPPPERIKRLAAREPTADEKALFEDEAQKLLPSKITMAVPVPPEQRVCLQ